MRNTLAYGSMTLPTIALLIILAACKGVDGGGATAASQQGKDTDRPCSVYIKDARSGEIDAFAADVSLTQQNDRKINGVTRQQNYRLRMKTIDGSLYTRVDFPASAGGEAPRTAISDGKEAVVFETESRKELSRVPISGQDQGFMPSRLMGRIDLVAAKTSLQKLAFDISSDGTGRYLMCSAPPALLAKISIPTAGRANALRLVFDLAQGTWVGSVQEEVLESGESVISTTANDYQVVDDQPVLTSQVITERHEIPGSLPVGEDLLPQIVDLDKIAEASQNDVDAAAKEGLAIDVDPPLGDRCDPNYTITTVIRYDNISLNDVQDSDMRILLTGGKG